MNYGSTDAGDDAMNYGSTGAQVYKFCPVGTEYVSINKSCTVCKAGQYQDHAIEFCLSHQLPTKVEKAYLRTNLIEMRKKIMKDWEEFVIKK